MWLQQELLRETQGSNKPAKKTIYTFVLYIGGGGSPESNKSEPCIPNKIQAKLTIHYLFNNTHSIFLNRAIACIKGTHMFAGTSLVAKEPPVLKPTKTVGIISDTHVPKKAYAVPKRVFEVFKNVDYIIHAGDIVELSVIDELEQIAPVLAVQGNMDGIDVANALPKLNSLRVFDYKIGVMHDPDVAFGFAKMRELVKENGFNVFVYGHTHIADIKWEDKTLYINPGSATVPPSSLGKTSVAILKISREKIEPEIIEITET